MKAMHKECNEGVLTGGEKSAALQHFRQALMPSALQGAMLYPPVPSLMYFLLGC